MSRQRPEKILQLKIIKFVRDAVTVSHRMACFDRGENDYGDNGPMGRHFWEKQRGIRSGEPDTELLVPGLPAIKIELKADARDPTDNQKLEGAAIIAAGHLWSWCHTVFGYGELLEGYGVPLARNWRIQAEHHDALIAAALAKAPLPKKPRAARVVKAPLARVRRFEAIRAKTLI